jgi:hypothetical protein
MATKQELLDELVQAYGSGVLTVQEDGRRVTYANGDDLMRRINQLRAEIGSTNTTRRPRVFRTIHRKGL